MKKRWDNARLVRGFEFRTGLPTQVNSAPDFDHGKTLVGLARHDFERALNVAQTLSHKPAKVAAMLTLTASVLKKADCDSGYQWRVVNNKEEYFLLSRTCHGSLQFFMMHDNGY